MLPVLRFSKPVMIVAAYCIFDPMNIAAMCPNTTPKGSMMDPTPVPNNAVANIDRKKLETKKKTAGAHGAQNILKGRATVGKCLC